MSPPPSRTPPACPSPGLLLNPALTSRERDVLSGVAHGKSARSIARDLGVSVNTVKTHMVKTLRKLHTGERTHAAVIAVRLGLIPFPEVEPSGFLNETRQLVLWCAACGMTAQQTAKSVQRTEGTVKTHFRRAIHETPGAEYRAGAVFAAARAGEIDLNTVPLPATLRLVWAPPAATRETT